ncbi:CaiB/BaiF CoA transferase family protein [Dactylosporangium sp. NPDC000521]|uniref:CaiB/BaiF CoA transferase family protein n=1 Tax=Dactylosporangium sp. NPDC000521 TaxID=3363975 RepID=UPI00368022C3
MSGPLRGVRVVEMAALGPVPHAAMMLADLGADVVRVDRPGGAMSPLAGVFDPVLRGRTHVVADLKSAGDRDAVLELLAAADVVLEGFRPGVMERLGLGPQPVTAANPRIVYGRITGWGRTGPLADAAGHDLNYLALTGVLGALGDPGAAPPVPLAVLGDYAGGSMFLLTGVLAALVERAVSGQGQVVDVAMVDGIGVVAEKVWAMRGAGTWADERRSNLLDGGAPFYDVYRCADDRYLAVAAIEGQFFAALLDGLGLRAEGDQHDRTTWPSLRARIAGRVASRTRDEWVEIFAGRDACVSPVLSFAEAAAHPQARARDAFVTVDGVVQPAPSPRFARTPAAPRGTARAAETTDLGTAVAAWRP